MKPLFSLIVISILSGDFVFCQQIKFNHVLGNGNNTDPFLSIAQDKYGFMWFTRQSGGLQRYDGKNLKYYKNDPNNPNSLASNYGECLVIDSDNIFWIGTYGSGLDRFDQSSNTFTHFRHNDHDNSTLSNDTITALLSDRSGNLWVGTLDGLNLWIRKQGNSYIISIVLATRSLNHNDKGHL
jgi:ligand-binding sensor domain-containing protein